MSAVTFKSSESSLHAYEAHARMLDGARMFVRGTRSDCVELSRLGACTHLMLMLTAAEAEAVGMELLAAASTVKALSQGGAA